MAKGEAAVRALERAIALREKEVECLELRRKGYELADIAEIVGYAGPSGVSAAIDRALNRTVDEAAEKFRLSEEQKLDEWEADLKRIAHTTFYAYSFGKLILHNDKPVIDMNPNRLAYETLLKLAARRSALRGGDAPKRTEIQVITDDAVQAEIKRLTKMADQMEAELAAELA